MTSQLNVDTIADKAGTGPVGLTKQFAARQWIKYGTGHTIDDSFQVSSLTDQQTGVGRVTFTNSMSNADYAFGNNSQAASTNTGKSIACANPTTALYDIETYENDSVADSNRVSAVTFGDLA
jgi:hypothetical protein